MRVRKKPRTEVQIERVNPVIVEKALGQMKIEESINEDIEIQTLKLELDQIKAELAVTKSSGNLSANEKKIISAIRSEALAQAIKKPIITRSMFKKTYKVSSRYLDPSIKNLISRGDIVRNQKAYTQNQNTYCYSVVQ
jgi:hypothetical protein